MAISKNYVDIYGLQVKGYRHDLPYKKGEPPSKHHHTLQCSSDCLEQGSISMMVSDSCTCAVDHRDRACTILRREGSRQPRGNGKHYTNPIPERWRHHALHGESMSTDRKGNNKER